MKGLVSFFTNSPFEMELWGLKDRWSCFTAASALFCDPTFVESQTGARFNDGTWMEWIVQVSLGCEKLLQEGYSDDDQLSFLRLYWRLIRHCSDELSVPWKDQRLASIKNPCIAFMLWILSHFRCEFPVLEPRALEGLDLRDPHWEQTLELSLPDARIFHIPSPTFIPLIRAILVQGTQEAQTAVISLLEQVMITVRQTLVV